MNPIIIDLAPGIHESLALYYAAKLGLDIRAIAVNGIFEENVIEASSLTAAICKDVGIEANIFPGAVQPIITGENASGRYPCAKGSDDGVMRSGVCAEIYAWDAVYDIVTQNPGCIDYICLGPLTNLAITLFRYPDIKQKISRVIFFGGALDWGNSGRTAEINMAADPHAADAVSKSGLDIVMIPWSVSRALGIDEKQVSRDYHSTRLIDDILQREKLPLEDAFVINHALAVLFAVDESPFTLRKHIIRIETKSSVCMGRTCANLMYSLKKDPPNMNVVRAVDSAALINLMMGILLHDLGNCR
ncbi:MAG: nucleoside hydrolase [Oscillospiraceae bacterium]|nr:nucleoside hydrolase [Oscillospiraceae bacterium]